MNEQLKKGMPLPSFHTKDIYGHEVSDQTLLGKKTTVVFLRFAGCPICSLHMLPLTQSLRDLKKSNVIYVYSSSQEKCLALHKQVGMPSHVQVIADPNLELYKLFGVKSGSIWQMISTMGSVMPKMSSQKKALTQQGIYSDVSKIGMDGSMLMLPADFLVDEKGKLVTTHYGKRWNDHLPIDETQNFLSVS